MEVEPKGELDRFLLLMRVESLDGITTEENNKILATISDETILEAAQRSMVPRDVLEKVLKERMKNWDINRLAKIAKGSDGRFSALAYHVLSIKLSVGPITDLQETARIRSPIIKKVVLEAQERKKAINVIRTQLGLKPF